MWYITLVSFSRQKTTSAFAQRLRNWRTAAVMLFSEVQWTFMCFILYMTVVQGRRGSICALKGSSVNLPCSALHATSNMSWYAVDANDSIYPMKELSTNGTTGPYSMADETNFTLTIKDVRESDAKLYCCKESTENLEFCSYNQTELRVAELQVKVIPATEGQTVTLMCSSSCPLTENPAAYIWYKNREFLYEDWSPWYQELLSGERGVTYSCAVKGYEHLRAPEISVDSVNETCFSVTYTKRSMCSHKPKSTDRFCSITYPTALRVQTTPARNFIIVTCNTSCPVTDPHSLYQWYWNGMVQSDCERQDLTVLSTGTHVLSCAVKGNEDVHSDETCIGASCWTVNYVSRRICALEGSSVTIKSENSLNYHSWHKVKIGIGEKDCTRVLSEAAGHVEHDVKNNNVLRINDVMRNDSAEYKLLRNSNNCHLPGVMLVVTGLKVTVIPSAVVTEGQRVTLTCSTSCPLTDDSTNYIWYLNGRPLTPRETQNKHLILDPVSCDHQGNYSCAVNASQMISSDEEGLTVKPLEKTVAALNALKMALLSLIPPAVVLLYLRTRKKKTVTATAEQNDREQPGQMDALYESVDLMARKPAAQ